MKSKLTRLSGTDRLRRLSPCSTIGHCREGFGTPDLLGKGGVLDKAHSLLWLLEVSFQAAGSNCPHRIDSLHLQLSHRISVQVSHDVSFRIAMQI